MVDDHLLDFLNCFLEEYYENYSDMFDLVYDFNEDNNEYENMARDNILFNKYLNDFKSNDSAIKLYDEIGIENVRKISLLAYLLLVPIYCKMLLSLIKLIIASSVIPSAIICLVSSSALANLFNMKYIPVSTSALSHFINNGSST